jgi:hypothetical protein
MPKFNVFLSPEVRVKICNIEADSQAEAIDKALDWFVESNERGFLRDRVQSGPHQQTDEDPYVEHTEMSEDVGMSLVDNVGDSNYSESMWYKETKDGWVPAFD